MVTRAYVVEIGGLKTTDVFESAKGAARFIVENIGTRNDTRAYVRQVTIGRYNYSWFEAHSMGGGMSHVLKPMSNDELTRSWAKLFRDNPGKTITIQVDDVPIASMDMAGEPRKTTLLFRITNADYFKGRKYPRYVSREAIEERYELDQEIRRLDDEAYEKARRKRRAEREELLAASTRIDPEELAKMSDAEIDELWEEMEMDSWLAELDDKYTRVVDDDVKVDVDVDFGRGSLSYEAWLDEYKLDKEYGVTFDYPGKGIMYVSGPKENVKKYLKESHYGGIDDDELEELFPELYED